MKFKLLTIIFLTHVFVVYSMNESNTQTNEHPIVINSLPRSLGVSALVARHAFVADQKQEPDYNAPDGSEITYLIKGQAGDFGDLCNCKLPIGKTSIAVKHQTVQELWNFTAGHGEFWLHDGESEIIIKVKKGTSILIHPGISFQFRNTSPDTTLESTITTMPPWPGPNEAVVVEGKWNPTVDAQHIQEAVKVDSESSNSSDIN